MKFAKQNLVKSPLRSFLMLFGFSFMMVVISLALSMKSVMEAYYIHAYQQRTAHIDLEMTIGPNSASRYFSTRDLTELGLNNHANVFKIDTLTDQDTYLTVLATNPSDFELLYQGDYTLSETEIIITKSSAKTLDLMVGDTVSLSIGTQTLHLTVKDILPDYGVFQGQTAYIAHDPHVASFLKTLFPPLTNYPNSFFSNFNNTVYFDTVDIEETKTLVSNIQAYQDLTFKESIPVDYIKQLVNRAVSLFQLMLIFIGIAVFLLIQTTYALVFKEKEQSLSIIKLLGGSLAFGFSIWAIEMVLLMIPATIIAYLLTYLIIQIGLNVLMPGLEYIVSIPIMLWSTGLVLGIFLLTTLLYGIRFNRKTEIARLSFKPDKNVSLRIHSCVVLASFGLIFWIGHDTLYESLWSLMLTIVVAYSLIKVIHQGVFKLISLFKEHSLPYLFKMTAVKKSFYRFMILALATFVSVTLLFQTTGYIKLKAYYIRREYQADLLMTNVLNNPIQVQNEIESLEGVEVASVVGIYRNVAINPSGQTLSAIYMLDPDMIPHYFGMKSEDDSLTDFIHSNEPSIWLPMRYKAVYDIEIGDVINLSINKEFNDVNLKVIGFFDEAVGNTAFINLYRFVEYQSLKQSNILIKTTQKEDIQKTLMDTYGHRLIYILDFQAGAKALSKEVITSMNYATFVIFIILFGLLLSLLNQGLILFDELKPNYMRVSLLGYSNRKLGSYLLTEGVLMMMTLTLSSIILLQTLNPLIKPLLLLFDEYEKITFSFSDLGMGLLFSNILLLITRVLYLKGLRQMNLVQILKMHQMD